MSFAVPEGKGHGPLVTFAACALAMMGLSPQPTHASTAMPQGEIWAFDFAYDTIDDLTWGQGDGLPWGSWGPYHGTVRAQDGRDFTLGWGTPTGTSMGALSVWTQASYLAVGDGIVPDIFYVQGLRDGAVVDHRDLALGSPVSQRTDLTFLGLYDEIRFGWHFPQGIDPALSARPGWYAPGADVQDFLDPGEVGCAYFDCGATMSISFVATDPQNGNRPATAPLASTPLPMAGWGLLGALGILFGLGRRATGTMPG